MSRKMFTKAFAVAGLCVAAGCDGAAAPGEVTPIGYIHGENSTPVQVNLKDYRFYPDGNGLRQSPGQIGNEDRTVDYSLALRTAAIKLRGDLPTMAEIRRVQTAADPGAEYAKVVEEMVNAPTFARQMMVFWRNQLRMGGPPIRGLFQDLAVNDANMRSVELETGPAFMAKLTVEGADMRRAFTEPGDACPTFNPANNTFTAGKCFKGTLAQVQAMASPGNGVPEGEQAGILTNPGFQAHYYSNMGFRRVRLIQELFACTSMPAEFAAKPQNIGGYVYSAPWPVDSVPSAGEGKEPTLATRRYRIAPPAGAATKETVNFSVQCQSCHSTMNHRAALFMGFDQVGFLSPDPNKSMVVTPVSFSPFTQKSEYIFNGTPAWKFGKTATTFREFGQHMAEDPEVQRCFIIRQWNNAYSRDDVVNELALVPAQVVQNLVAFFQQNNFNLKATIQKMYTDSNFIRF